MTQESLSPNDAAIAMANAVEHNTYMDNDGNTILDIEATKEQCIDIFSELPQEILGETYLRFTEILERRGIDFDTSLAQLEV